MAEAGVAGVDVDGDEREVDRRAATQHVEDLQQGPAVLAAGQPDHDAIAVLNQVVIDDRGGDLLRDARFERTAIAHENLWSIIIGALNRFRTSGFWLLTSNLSAATPLSSTALEILAAGLHRGQDGVERLSVLHDAEQAITQEK